MSIIPIIEKAVRKAGRSLARDFGEVENLQVSKKGPGNFVTSADLRADKILREELGKALPDYNFLTEESGEIKGKDTRFKFIIDPLDGTTNFMHGLPHFCISIAVEETLATGKKELIAGVVYAPVFDEFYFAEKGKGAFVVNSMSQKRKLQVSAREDFEEAVVCGYISRDKARYEKDYRAMAEFGTHSRILGASALDLAYVAAGKIDAIWHKGLKSWDMAAGIVLVREARGVVSEILGGDEMLKNGNILATNQNIYNKVHDKLKNHYQS
jgi:myo-inositol-1(or 4)-monophosphatase